MNEYISASVMFRYDLEGVEPVLSTSFRWSVKEDDFSEIKKLIDGVESFTDEQKDHFKKCVDYVLHCDKHPENFASVHIVSSTCNGNTHYIKMINTEYVSDKSDIDANKLDRDVSGRCMYINYNPAIFKNRNLLDSLASLGVPFRITVDNESNGRRSEINIGNTVTTSNITNMMNIVACANSMAWVFLYYYYGDKDMVKNFFETPFSSSLKLIWNCVIYGWAGKFVSNISPPYSNLIFNGILGYVNYKMFCCMRH